MKLTARTEKTSGFTPDDLAHVVSGGASWKAKLFNLANAFAAFFGITIDRTTVPGTLILGFSDDLRIDTPSGNVRIGGFGNFTCFRAFAAEAWILPSGGSIANEGSNVMAINSNVKIAQVDPTGFRIAAAKEFQLGVDAVAETPTPTHTLVILDKNGVAYKVLAVVA